MKRGSQNAWEGLEKLFLLGSHLQATAVKLVPREKVLPPDAGPSPFKLSQGGAEMVGKKQPTILKYEIIAVRTSAEKAVDIRTAKTVAKAPKDRGNIHIFRAPELDTGNLIATHGPLLKG